MSPPLPPGATFPSLPRLVGSTALTLLAAAGASYFLPASWAADGTAAVFLAATWWLCLRSPEANAGEWGLELGGLLSRESLDWKVMARAAGRATALAAVAATIVFPPFFFAFWWWWAPTATPHLPSNLGSLSLWAGQVAAIALPEEAFFRGYLWSSLRHRLPRYAGSTPLFEPANLVTSAVFALGHFATIPQPGRLAVFFPSLLFGLLRARSGGIGASVLFHAACNLYALLLASAFTP